MEELSQAKSTLEEENNEKDMIIEGAFDVVVMNMNNVKLFFFSLFYVFTDMELELEEKDAEIERLKGLLKKQFGHQR